MKKILAIAAVALVVSMSSCNKKGSIVCKQSFIGVTWKYTIDDDGVKYCVARVCEDEELGSYTKEEYAADLEASGYDCKYY